MLLSKYTKPGKQIEYKHLGPGIREAGVGAGGASNAQSVTFPTSMVTPLMQFIIQFYSKCPTLQNGAISSNWQKVVPPPSSLLHCALVTHYNYSEIV